MEKEPWTTKIIFQRHERDKKETRKEIYLRFNIDEESLIDFLAEKNIIDEKDRVRMEKAKFIEDELIRIIDEGKLLDSPEEEENPVIFLRL